MTASTNCRNCDRKVTRRDWANQAELCAACYHIAGLENDHYDGNHDDEADIDCPFCFEVEGMTAIDTASHSHSSHAACYEQGLHAKTKAGRAACRSNR